MARQFILFDNLKENSKTITITKSGQEPVSLTSGDHPTFKEDGTYTIQLNGFSSSGKDSYVEIKFDTRLVSITPGANCTNINTAMNHESEIETLTFTPEADANSCTLTLTMPPPRASAALDSSMDEPPIDHNVTVGDEDQVT